MSVRSRGTRPNCRPEVWDPSRELSAFVLVLLPELQGKPQFEDHYSLTDRFYSCFDASVCRCPIVPRKGTWKTEATNPGGVFDGRVQGKPPQNLELWKGEWERMWDYNLVRPLEMAEPVSAFAIITPDGLWHECVEPEPQDLVNGLTKNVEWPDLVDSERKLTHLQVAWRFEVANVLVRYQHCWLLGLDATLSLAVPRKCAAEEAAAR